jgi:hypothetical protein
MPPPAVRPHPMTRRAVPAEHRVLGCEFEDIAAEFAAHLGHHAALLFT